MPLGLCGSKKIKNMNFKNKTIFITGASRGIGKAIALRLAKEGANIVVAAKSTVENPKLGGTIFSAAKDIEEAGGRALAVQCDIRDEAQIQEAVQKAVDTFGGIDVLINNASAISLTGTEATEPKRFDLMHDINVRGTFMMSRACIPFLKKGNNPHIITLSPPINLDMKWFKNHIAYTLSKYNMTMIALGLAEELKQFGVASNALWPQTTIATAANRRKGDKYSYSITSIAKISELENIITTSTTSTRIILFVVMRMFFIIGTIFVSDIIGMDDLVWYTSIIATCNTFVSHGIATTTTQRCRRQRLDNSIVTFHLGSVIGFDLCHNTSTATRTTSQY